MFKTACFLVLVLTAISSANELDSNGKYLQQTDSSSCSVIAAVNSVKSLNHTCNEIAWFKYLRRTMRVNNYGSTFDNLIVGMSKITANTNIKYKSMVVNDIKILQNITDKRVIIVSGFRVQDNMIIGHTFLINNYNTENQKYTVINFNSDKNNNILEVKQEKLKRYFQLKNRPPLAIIVEKLK